MKSQANNGRPGTAQETAQRAGTFDGSDHSLEKGNEFRSERLVKIIGQRPPQIVVVAARQSRGDKASVAARLNRAQAIDFVRQDPARFGRLDFKSGNQKDKMQVRIDRKLLVAIVARNNKAAKLGRRGVVGMALKLGTKLEDPGALERAIKQGIEPVEHSQPYRHTAAQPARSRHLALDYAGKGKGLAAGCAKKSAGCLLRHCTRFEPVRARDCHQVVELQGDTEAIEAGA